MIADVFALARRRKAVRHLAEAAGTCFRSCVEARLSREAAARKAVRT